MPNPARDIEELEAMYIAGESNDDCSRKAMLIAVRIRDERKSSQSKGDMVRLNSIGVELGRFQTILKKIAGRSTDPNVNPLQLYHDFLISQKIIL